MAGFPGPAGSGEPALVDVDRMFVMRSPAICDVRAALGPLVQAATQHRVQRVVVLSVMGVNPALPHWRMERIVHVAGLPTTALRSSYFAQNLLTAFGEDTPSAEICKRLRAATERFDGCDLFQGYTARRRRTAVQGSPANANSHVFA